MLWKNFGVTRHGKVVFYDYDEIEYLTDCNFRKVPTPRNEEEEMSGEVWYRGRPERRVPRDVRAFLLGNPGVRNVFMRHHADLLEASFWQGHKDRILAGYVHDVFPYDAHQALRAPPRTRRIELIHPARRAAMATDPIVIVSAARTPIGGLLGEFFIARRASAWRDRDQGRGRARRHLRRRGRRGADRQLPDGRPGPGAGRQAVLGAGLPQSSARSPCRRCAARGCAPMMFAHDMLASETASVVIAGGMESMTNAPHLTAMRKGVKYGVAQLYDHMALDGLEDAYEKLPGVDGKPAPARRWACSPRTASRSTASRARSRMRSRSRRPSAASRPTKTAASTGRSRRSACRQERRHPDQVRRAAVQGQARQDPGLKPAFKKDGTITAATSSSISDGAAALVLMRASTAVRLGVAPLARIRAHAGHAQAPNWFATAPAGAIAKVLQKTGWSAKDVDLWEVNEAFAAVTLAAMAEFKLSHEIVNVHGGAVALGHPIGASGARIVVTLLGALAPARLEEGRRGAVHRRRRGDRARAGAGVMSRRHALGARVRARSSRGR